MLFLQANRELKARQGASLGSDHPDLARTHLDLSQGLKRLLRIAPVAFQTAPGSAVSGLGPGLFQAGVDSDDAFPPAEWGSVSAAVKAEQAERRNHERIRSKYTGF